MSIHRTSKSGLFLLELMIIILFFSITSAVCVRLFVSAHLVSRENEELNHAMLVAQTAAESFKAADGDSRQLQHLFPLEALPDGSYEACYSREWQATSSTEQPAYILTLTPDYNNTKLPGATIAVHRAQQDVYIFGLEVKCFTGTEGGAAG